MTCPNTISYKPFSHLQSREVIRQFTPNWFAATMGTGVLALALAQLPSTCRVCAPCRRAVAVQHWLVRAVQCLVCGALGAVFRRGPADFRPLHGIDVLRHHSHGPGDHHQRFSGVRPAALGRCDALAEVLWWLDVAMSLACGVLIPYMMFTRQEHSIDQMTAVWLLPVVAAEVAAASGGLLAALVDAHSQLVVLVTSYVLWAFSLPVAFSI
jgi:tellurite resistance protein TehA-like permease